MKKFIFALIIFGLIWPPIAYCVEPYRGVAAVSLAGGVLGHPDGGVDNTPTEKYRRSKCPHCKGSGKLKSGDGLYEQECPYCEPDKQVPDYDTTTLDELKARISSLETALADKDKLIKEAEPQLTEKQKHTLEFVQKGLKWNTPNRKCSPDCKCGTCTCMWPWECEGLTRAESDARMSSIKDQSFWSNTTDRRTGKKANIICKCGPSCPKGGCGTGCQCQTQYSSSCGAAGCGGTSYMIMEQGNGYRQQYGAPMMQGGCSDGSCGGGGCGRRGFGIF